MRRKTFALVKEAVATGSHADALGGAQVAKVYQIPERPHKVRHGRSTVAVSGGRNLTANEAHRIVALVSLGKRSVLFRIGNDVRERGGAIHELATFLRDRKDKTPFPENVRRCIAAAALDELAHDKCPVCKGRGVIPMVADAEGRQPMAQCPSCAGSLKRRYSDDERILKLAREWANVNPKEPGDVTVIAGELRKHPRLHALLASIGTARAILIEAERVAIEETARMAERW